MIGVEVELSFSMTEPDTHIYGCFLVCADTSTFELSERNLPAESVRVVEVWYYNL